MNTAAEIIARVSVSDVFVALGGDPPRRGRAKAFWRPKADGLNVSLDDGKGAWFDHRDGIGGGVLDLVQHIRGGGRADALKWIAAYFGLPLDVQSPSERAEAARRRRAAEGEARALAFWKADLIYTIQSTRESLVRTYCGALRFLQAHSFDYYEQTADPRYDVAWELLYSLEPKIAELDRRYDVLVGANYDELLPIFRELRERTARAA